MWQVPKRTNEQTRQLTHVVLSTVLEETFGHEFLLLLVHDTHRCVAVTILLSQFRDLSQLVSERMGVSLGRGIEHGNGGASGRETDAMLRRRGDARDAVLRRRHTRHGAFPREVLGGFLGVRERSRGDFRRLVVRE